MNYADPDQISPGSHLDDNGNESIPSRDGGVTGGCEYCHCCSTVKQHIEQHYDPSSITEPGADARETLDSFKACFPDEDVPLTLSDVQDYIDSLSQE